MEKKVLDNHKRWLERAGLCRSFGYDIEKERIFVIKKAQPIYGILLEAGTGKGNFTLALAKKGYSFITFDISKEEQEFAKLNLKYFGLDKSVDFRIENGEHLSFESNSFDTVISVNTLHHLDNPYMVADEFIRVLSFGGKIILSDFTKTGFDIISKIQASEGKTHKINKITLLDMGNYLTKKNFKTNKYRDKFQEVLVAYKK